MGGQERRHALLATRRRAPCRRSTAITHDGSDRQRCGVCGAREGGRPRSLDFEDFIKISSRIYPAPRSLDF